MPIYAYRCAACGHSRDVLRKISDPALTECPACGADQFRKQVTAAGFQLKGSGWYVTDFRNGSGNAGSAASTPAAGGADGAPAASPAPAADGGSSGSGGSGGGVSASSSGCAGGGCACH